jgi:MFS family permease
LPHHRGVAAIVVPASVTGAHPRAARRYASGLLFLCLLCIGMGQSMLFSILPPAARDLGISPFEISTIFATSASIWVFVSPWWGRRSDAWGRRPVILTGLLGYALSMALLASVIAVGQARLLPAMLVYPLLVVSRSVFALLGSGTGPAAQAYVADRTRIAERAAAVAFLGAGLGLGETVGPAVGAALAAVGLKRRSTSPRRWRSRAPASSGSGCPRRVRHTPRAARRRSCGCAIRG